MIAPRRRRGRGRRLRLGVLPFLNARPLVHGLSRGGLRGRYDLLWADPAAIARRLAAGELDAGILSVAALADAGEPYRIVPDLAIASDGPVWSVRLFHRGPLQGVRRIVLDRRSRTSTVLARLLLEERFGIRPRHETGDPDPLGLEAGEACVAIGDPGLRSRHLPSLDLGEVWRRWVGLPFVYAVWAAHPGRLGEGDVRALQASLREGRAAIDLLDREAIWEGWPAGLAKAYLTEAIRFRLGPREMEGLATFLERARRCAFVSIPRDLAFTDGRTVPLAQPASLADGDRRSSRPREHSEPSSAIPPSK